MLADGVRAHPGLLDQGLPGQVNGVRADLVWFLRAVSDRAHDCQFSLPERHREGGPQDLPIGLVAVPLTKNTVNMRMSDALRRAGDAAHATGRAFRSGGQASGQGHPADRGFGAPVTGAQGADRTGLGTLIEMTAASGAADAFVTVALAGTIFFSTSVDQARGRVVLFLIITMAPFAVLAPFIGPALDRIQQGRRFVLAGTMLTRGLLCYAMSANVANSVTLLPAAFGILVLQKAGGVVKASVTPRLLPAEITLVTANARSGLISIATSTAAAGLAAGVQFAGGAAWTLRVGTLIYLAAMVLALRLPEQIDVPAAAPAPVPAPPSREPPTASTDAAGHAARPRCRWRAARAAGRAPQGARALAHAGQRRSRRRRGDDGQRGAARLLRLHPVPAGVPAAQRGPGHGLRPRGVAQLRARRARARPVGRQPRLDGPRLLLPRPGAAADHVHRAVRSRRW